ncbi:MAG TPA: radical SAM protein [Planctomycetaceae bacterium]|jgi:wyosine [tRNA(Phe)-imidazoG37] synthetase (radical SAM superfamily)|nr:radical SAM protein [Pirellulales bacterium]HCP83678.1 radical SAM protein [Planctomycetaceae bacterium]
MATESLHSNHNRIYGSNRFVYPVLSRRSNGVSLGVNLNPDKVCNFDCIYCQVDRTTRSETRFVEMDQLLAELRTTLDFITSGEFFGDGPFKDIPPELKRLNDIAFSGDGEPTTYKNFDEIISACASLKQELELDDVKMVLITNASMFHRDHVKAGLQILDENQGEIWAKLEAGTEAYFQTIDRTSFKLQEIVDNISAAAQRRSVVIQSLFMNVNGVAPSNEELLAFCSRLSEIVTAGGAIDHVQVYTVARPPAESFVTALSNSEVDQIVTLVKEQTGITAVPYYGIS